MTGKASSPPPATGFRRHASALFLPWCLAGLATAFLAPACATTTHTRIAVREPSRTGLALRLTPSAPWSIVASPGEAPGPKEVLSVEVAGTQRTGTWSLEGNQAFVQCPACADTKTVVLESDGTLTVLDPPEMTLQSGPGNDPLVFWARRMAVSREFIRTPDFSLFLKEECVEFGLVVPRDNLAAVTELAPQDELGLLPLVIGGLLLPLGATVLLLGEEFGDGVYPIGGGMVAGGAALTALGIWYLADPPVFESEYGIPP